MVMAELGRADWLYDPEQRVHVAMCSHVGAHGQRCGDGPLALSQIPAGDCGRHDVVSAMRRRREHAGLERLGRIIVD